MTRSSDKPTCTLGSYFDDVEVEACAMFGLMLI